EHAHWQAEAQTVRARSGCAADRKNCAVPVRDPDVESTRSGAEAFAAPLLARRGGSWSVLLSGLPVPAGPAASVGVSRGRWGSREGGEGALGARRALDDASGSAGPRRPIRRGLPKPRRCCRALVPNSVAEAHAWDRP